MPTKFLSDALRHFDQDVGNKPIRDPLEKGRTLMPDSANARFGT